MEVKAPGDFCQGSLLKKGKSHKDCRFEETLFQIWKECVCVYPEDKTLQKIEAGGDLRERALVSS